MKVVLAVTAVLTAGLMVGSPASGAINCFGAPATIVGTGQADNIVGTQGRDVIVALGGQDTVQARGGDDLVCGGTGGDVSDLGAGQDKANGGGGRDDLVGGSAKDLLLGKGGGDGLFGGGGADISKGHGGNDLIIGGPGGDKLVGGQGNELLIPLGGDDRVIGSGGNFDLVDFFRGPITVDLAVTGAQNTGEGTDRITQVEGVGGTPDDDQIFGNALATPAGNGLFGEQGSDEIDGRANVDFISGGAGDDVGVTIYGLDGGTGPDFIFGGGGDDELNGEEGDDELLGEEGDDQLIGGEADETIGDFGSGGEGSEDEGGDVCSELEDDDGTCETLNPRSSSVTASHSSGSPWAGLRHRMVVRAARRWTPSEPFPAM
jgi:Ca2+-binding RTX toxin-like protein